MPAHLPAHQLPPLVACLRLMKRSTRNERIQFCPSWHIFWEYHTMAIDETERLRRWRLVLGKEAGRGMGEGKGQGSSGGGGPRLGGAGPGMGKVRWAL